MNLNLRTWLWLGAALLALLPADTMAQNSLPQQPSRKGLIAANKVAARDGIFAYSNRQQSSRILGATGVPAYVMAKGTSRRGFYIMSVANGGNWRRMHLQPGDLLTSVDNRSITDGNQADSVLNSMANGDKVVVFSRVDDDGHPQFVTVRAAIVSSDTAQIASTGSSSGRSGAAHESVDALESYGLQLVNEDRAREGHLPPMTMNASLSKLARDYAQYLVETKRFAHVDDKGRNPEDRAKEHGIKAGVFENLAFQQYGWGSERDMIKASEKTMMSEPSGVLNHRSNIMGENRKYAGVGVATDGHQLMMVHEFTDSEP